MMGLLARLLQYRTIEQMKTQGRPRHKLWPTVRAAHLRAFPSCSCCGITEDLQVHHIQPFHRFPELELVSTNLITLCESNSHNCHFMFGHGLNWQLWNPDVITDALYIYNRMLTIRMMDRGQ